ncbi:uncharacterized protein [Lolium perenne]|uniref:uncharacterized protein isoform X3 n=1 Tax=Lolium perenne TaxID=4522 RepID=UPI0021F522E2|nr:uncharacterized protein LOC127313576 isoform X2 [Lolium perenne]
MQRAKIKLLVLPTLLDRLSRFLASTSSQMLPRIQAKEATESAFKDGKQLLKLRMGLILASVVRVILSRMMIPVTIHVWFFSSNLKQGTAKRTETHLHGMKTGELGNAPC